MYRYRVRILFVCTEPGLSMLKPDNALLPMVAQSSRNAQLTRYTSNALVFYISLLELAFHTPADVQQAEWYPGEHQNNIYNKATSFIIHKLNVIFISLSDTYNYDKLTCFRECASAACIYCTYGLAIVRHYMLVLCCGLYLQVGICISNCRVVQRWLYRFTLRLR